MRRIFHLIFLLGLLLSLPSFAVCTCVSSGGAVNRKADDSFWSAGNCLGGQLISSCNDLSGSNDDCTLNCSGCAYQATDASAFETGCWGDAGCTATPCNAVPELSSPFEIWHSLQLAWNAFFP